MICTCGKFTIPVRHMYRKAHYCTNCGRLAKLDYWTGRLVVLWRPRRYGRKVG